MKISNINDMPSWLFPNPTDEGSSTKTWTIGDLSDGENYFVEWEDTERISYELPDFVVTRNLDDIIILDGIQSIIQSITITIQPLDTSKTLMVAIGYGQELVTVAHLSHNYEGSAIVDSEGSIEWRLQEPLAEEYVLEATYNIERKEGVVGDVTVYPGCHVSLREITGDDLPNTNYLSENVEIGVVEVGILNLADWDQIHEVDKGIVFPWFEDAPEPIQAGVNLLDSYEYRVLYDTTTVDDSSKELLYDLELDIQPWSGALEGTELTITNPNHYSTDDVSGPEPTSLDPDLYWVLGTINEGEGVDVHWHIPEMTIFDTLGFSVTRTVDPTIIPEELPSISQKITFDVNHYDTDNRLHVVVEYRQDIVDAFVAEFDHPEIADHGDGWIEWILSPGHVQHYTFTVSFDVQRKTGVDGEIEVFPQCRVDSRSSSEFQDTSVNVPLDAGTVTVTTSNVVSWNINDEDGKILWFEGCEYVRDREINVRINDWYSTVTDPSYEQVYENIVTSYGAVYSHGKMYSIGVSWSGIDSDVITVQDKLKPNLQLEASISDNPPPQGCGEIFYNYDPETGDVILDILDLDKREGSVTVQWDYMGPDLELDVYKTPPRVNRVSDKIQTDSCFKLSNAISAFHLNSLETLAYMVKQTYVWADSTLYPSLLHMRPEPTSVSTGGGWGQIQWFYEENPVTPGRIPLDDYYEPCHTIWNLNANGELQVTNSFLIRYVGEGNDLPTMLRDGAFKTIVTCDATGDVVKGWEGVPNWHFLKKAGPVRSVFNLHVFQPAGSEKELKIFNPTVNSHVVLSNTLTDPYYELRFSTYVNDVDGLDDIDYVKVIYPDGTEQYLLDEYYDFGYHPPGDGEYFNIVPVDYQITGEFTFVVVDKEGNLDQTIALLDEWLPPFNWVYPSFGELILEENLYFDWELPIQSPTSMQKYEIRLGYGEDPHPGFWQTSVTEPLVEYTGSYPLNPGSYWWWITGWSQKGNLVILDAEFQLE